MTTQNQDTAAEFVAPIDPETSTARTEVPDPHGEPSAQVEPAQPEAVPQSGDVEPSAPVEPAQPEAVAPSADVEPSVHVEPQQPQAAPPRTEVEPSGDESLFGADPSGMRARWDDIQVAFVDDPSGCVQKADGLVEEVIQQLTSRFADTRSVLEAQWARGEQASTEDLRLALTRYREFFQRLLTV